MKTIYKFHIEIIGEQVLMIPKNHELLTIQSINNEVYIYYMVDPYDAKSPINIQIFGTGQPIEDSAINHSKYIGTVQTNNGGLIWHIFEKKD